MVQVPKAAEFLPGIPIALLVDGDNATATSIGPILVEASKYGTLVIRRVYGDWTSPSLGQWRKVLQAHALSPIQQFANVSGKNATDSALIIDAMDILHSDVVSGFCIVSSDSDYTRLAMRIREAGLFVCGIGRASTPAAFVNACNVFVTVENLTGVPEPARSESTSQADQLSLPNVAAGSGPVESQGTAGPVARLPIRDALPILRKAYLAAVGEGGRVHLASLGNTLLKLDPAFDSRTYGCSKLVQLLESLQDDFEVERHPERGPGSVYVRMKGTT